MSKPTPSTTEELLLHDSDTKPKSERAIAAHVREIIRLVGEDPEREGLRKPREKLGGRPAAETSASSEPASAGLELGQRLLEGVAGEVGP